MSKTILLSNADKAIYGEAVDLFYRNFTEHPEIRAMYFDNIVPVERILVMVRNKQVLGALKRGYNHNRGVVTIDFLAISEPHRCEGLGKRLVSSFEDLLREKGIEKVGLRSRQGVEVLDFYKKQGYQEVEGYVSYWMEKQLI